MATLQAAASLGLKTNISVLIAATENAIGPGSYKPGDVYKSYAGKTVEVTNTDAEGRLILADALAYAVANLKPSRIIATRTMFLLRPARSSSFLGTKTLATVPRGHRDKER